MLTNVSKFILIRCDHVYTQSKRHTYVIGDYNPSVRVIDLVSQSKITDLINTLTAAAIFSKMNKENNLIFSYCITPRSILRS